MPDNLRFFADFKSKVMALGICAFCSGNAFASTNVSGSVSGTWNLAGSPYIVTADIQLNNGSTLTIDPGVVVKFNANTGMSVSGVLRALGTAEQPVYFTSVDDNSVGGVTGTGSPQPGNWKNIAFNSSTSNDLSSCLLQYSVIRYGGGSSAGNVQIYYPYSSYSLAAVAKPVISSCTISNSSNYGLYMSAYCIDCDYSSNVVAPSLNDVQISSNASYGIYIRATQDVNYVNMYMTGNGYNGVGITNAYAGRWRNLGYPYLVPSDLATSGSNTLIIDPGVVVKFNMNTGIAIYGVLRALGTAEQPVYFTSVDDNSVGGVTGTGSPQPGSWKNIAFYSSTSNDLSSCLLQYSVIRYGGGSSAGNVQIYYPYSSYSLAAVAKPVISSCTISNSSNYGIYMNAYYTSGYSDNVILPAILYCRFANNATHAYNKVSNTVVLENNWWEQCKSFASLGDFA